MCIQTDKRSSSRPLHACKVENCDRRIGCSLYGPVRISPILITDNETRRVVYAFPLKRILICLPRPIRDGQSKPIQVYRLSAQIGSVRSASGTSRHVTVQRCDARPSIWDGPSKRSSCDCVRQRASRKYGKHGRTNPTSVLPYATRRVGGPPWNHI